MRITIAHNSFPIQGLEKGKTILLQKETTIRQLIARFGQASEWEPYVIAVVDGKVGRLDQALRDGNSLSLYQLSAGG